MARRRNLKDLLTPEPTPDKQLTHPSGWCITNEHDGCKYQFNHGKCGCWCHTGKPKPVKIIDEDAPKPKRSTRAPKPTSEIASKTQKTQSPRTKTASIGVSDYVDPRPWKRK